MIDPLRKICGRLVNRPIWDTQRFIFALFLFLAIKKIVNTHIENDQNNNKKIYISNRNFSQRSRFIKSTYFLPEEKLNFRRMVNFLSSLIIKQHNQKLLLRMNLKEIKWKENQHFLKIQIFCQDLSRFSWEPYHLFTLSRLSTYR